MDTLRKHHPLYENYHEGTADQWVELSRADDKLWHYNNNRFLPYKTFNKSIGMRASFGVNTWAEHEEVLTTVCYQECLDLLEKEQVFLPPLNKNIRRLSWDTMGDELDRNRLYAGEMECWRVAKKRPVPNRPFMTIICNTSISWGTNCRVLMWRAVAAMNLCNAAEQNGFRVKLISTYGGGGAYIRAVRGSTDCYIGCIAKDFNQPLNLNALSVIVGYGGWFRDTLFNVLYRSEYPIDQGLGYPTACELQPLYPNCFTVPTSVSNKESATKWYEEQLAFIHKLAKEAA